MNLTSLNQLKITRQELQDILTNKFLLLSKEQINYDKIKQDYHETKLSFMQMDRKIALIEKTIIKAKKPKRTRKLKRNSKCPNKLIALLKGLSKEKRDKVIKEFESMK